MARISFELKRWDYGNDLLLGVRIAGDPKATPGDMLDAVINWVAPRIRKGEMSGSKDAESKPEGS
jgi:hypothetical protein